jgi:hypothetical protein
MSPVPTANQHMHRNTQQWSRMPELPEWSVNHTGPVYSRPCQCSPRLARTAGAGAGDSGSAGSDPRLCEEGNQSRAARSRGAASEAQATAGNGLHGAAPGLGATRTGLVLPASEGPQAVGPAGLGATRTCLALPVSLSPQAVGPAGLGATRTTRLQPLAGPRRPPPPKP